MARTPFIPQDTALEIADQLAQILRATSNIKSLGAAGDALQVEIDVSLPIRALDPSASGQWDPSVDVSLQAPRTEYWHHQLRVLDVIDCYATSRFVTESNVRPVVASVGQRSPLARSIDSAITIIDRDEPDDAYVACILKIPTHAVLAIMLSHDQQGSELFVVTSPRSFERVQPGKRYRTSGEFLEDLNSERAGGGYKPYGSVEMP